MADIATMRSDGTLAGVITHINGAFARGEIAKMIVVIVPDNGDVPTMGFCQTDSLAEELGLLEIAKNQAFISRNILR